MEIEPVTAAQRSTAPERLISRLSPDAFLQVRYVSVRHNGTTLYRFTPGQVGCGHAGLVDPGEEVFSAGFLYLSHEAEGVRCLIAPEGSMTLRKNRKTEDKEALAEIFKATISWGD